jgi:hypothetical protein
MSNPEYDRVLALLPKLTKFQQNTFSRICINDDSNLHRNTVRTLQKLGLIDYGLVSGVWRAAVSSTAAHMAWAKWCGDQMEAINDDSSA